MRTFIAQPDGSGPFPAVVMIQHAFGVDDVIQKLAERLSKEGIVVAAPDLYHRQTDSIIEDMRKNPPKDFGEALQRLQPKIAQIRDNGLIADVNATVAALQAMPNVRANAIGITGFCSGGRVTYLGAATNPAFKAAAVFYGGNIMRALGDGPSPFERTPQINCPVIGFFGLDDQNPSPDDVQKIDAELTKHHKPHEFHSYPGVGHGFVTARNEVANGPQSNDAWAKMVAFFKAHLGEPARASAG
jgi:carboxymethylenebutenolidase